MKNSDQNQNARREAQESSVQSFPMAEKPRVDLARLPPTAGHTKFFIEWENAMRKVGAILNAYYSGNRPEYAEKVSAAAYAIAELEQLTIRTEEQDAREFEKYESGQWHDADARDRHAARTGAR